MDDMITYLPASDRIAVPWKNGGGVTCEVAVFPPGAGMDDFDWRVSMAEVIEAGPFSVFPDIDRHLTVLEGVLQLTMFTGQQITLHRHESLAFRGDLPVTGVPLAPVVDLNVMIRRGRFRASVRQVSGGQTPVGTSILIATDDSPCRIGAHEFAPQRYDAFLCDADYVFLSCGVFFYILLSEQA